MAETVVSLCIDTQIKFSINQEFEFGLRSVFVETSSQMLVLMNIKYIIQNFGSKDILFELRFVYTFEFIYSLIIATYCKDLKYSS